MTDGSHVWLHASCVMSFDVQVPTPLVLMLRPRSGPTQWIAREHYHLAPAVEVAEYTDGFGNLCQRLVAPTGDFQVHTTADVMVRPEPPMPAMTPFVPVPDLPDDTLGYLLASRYCESDRLSDLAWEVADGAAPGGDQVLAISRWIARTIRYTPCSSAEPLSASEVLNARAGVCRDLAQVGIALCRALCIPARLVVGYLAGLTPMDVHAWFEAYVGHRWHTFDATPTAPAGPRIAIACGRDATDVAIYNQFGPPLLPRDIRVDVAPLSAAP